MNMLITDVEINGRISTAFEDNVSAYLFQLFYFKVFISNEDYTIINPLDGVAGYELNFDSLLLGQTTVEATRLTDYKIVRGYYSMEVEFRWLYKSMVEA